MAEGTENSNYFAKIDSINSLIEQYNTSITQLTNYYIEIEQAINSIAINKFWQGESYNNFLSAFNEWKIQFTKDICYLINIKNALLDVASVTQLLISQRDNLSTTLI